MELESGSFLINGQNEKIYNTWTNNYFDFLQRNADRIISIPMLVDIHEFYDRELSKRPYDWSVLGSNYDAREIVKNILDINKIKQSGKIIPYAHAFAKYMGVNIYAHYWTLSIFNSLFHQALKNSRFSFTCGSVLKYPVRKFFEIPASGNVLVTDGCMGFKNLGFEDKKNALICKPDEILDAHDWLLRKPERAQAIAHNGQKLVFNMHSVSARGQQLDEIFKLIYSGVYKGNYWSNGKIMFR